MNPKILFYAHGFFQFYNRSSSKDLKRDLRFFQRSFQFYNRSSETKTCILAYGNMPSFQFYNRSSVAEGKRQIYYTKNSFNSIIDLRSYITTFDPDVPKSPFNSIIDLQIKKERDVHGDELSFQFYNRSSWRRPFPQRCWRSFFQFYNRSSPDPGLCLEPGREGGKLSIL